MSIRVIPLISGGPVSVSVVVSSSFPHAPYTQEELQAAFDRVKDKQNWKNPIDAVVAFADADEKAKLLPMIQEAVIHFTATEANILNLGPLKVHIIADGYYLGPAGDC